MRVGSVCSGIEAAAVAWHPLGWEFAFSSDIDPFANAVRAHHYPEVPNFGDMTKFKDWPDATIDLLVGGTPCQAFSVAGLRKGLADPRGNLTLTYLAVAARYRPEWLVWENVPGVLSDREAFGAFLGGLSELGYGWAYRVLDAQYFGLAQRRKRVFVVASARGWQRAAAVLFEPASLSGHPAPRREAREGFAAATAPSLTASGQGVERTGESRGQNPVVAIARCVTTGEGTRQDYETTTLVACDVAETLTVGASQTWGRPGGEPVVAHALRAEGFDASEGGTGRGTPLVPVAAPLTAAKTLAVQQAMQVRRLTPEECEALQGFPRGYTLIPYRGKPAADGPRYKALGNSMAVPVMHWIGRRIQIVHSAPVSTIHEQGRELIAREG